LLVKLAAKPAPALPPLGTIEVVVNDMCGGVPVPQDLLVRLVDLPADARRAAEGRFATEWATTVKPFQSRHGLHQDGVLVGQTLAALNVALAGRVTQIELSLERLRGLRVLRGATRKRASAAALHRHAFVRDAVP
jgi:hypothetical protein